MILIPTENVLFAACVDFAYEPDSYGISFTVTLDDKTLINETISGI